MIPTMILFALILARWWRIALVAAVVVWPVVVLADGTISSAGEILAAALLGVANAAVGVAAHQVVLQTVRRWG